jgi:hypothetical protein
MIFLYTRITNDITYALNKSVELSIFTHYAQKLKAFIISHNHNK